ncbi:MAG: hypothetical protein A2233_00130 [Candidatus Kerfeldbacteria bacterium RIFOXYA2_FULL_38_24]|uniref:Colicin V production protein n=1 Tax=Candidatus Kerfeldbacteria bacterium RIFOXYB2_FULL_38_14 TaxID=1798547 RepID=A0A1G2BA50_9BACT|nr:MAG: hypothetical protein A2233_00130 [Candidatus Kerfeldbacteria bacterium RIFOXYA2_FULL_38_24]OGY86002.1 MAG: hypothetical protein A2319_00335 [Candidatus Kerfeldbacteria bacterium RIFOXYB2_FULL_38_14]OGY90114.1 MAG: hypothetical protein A2458_03930 [Candidatus Kerfeldbacteria bacterium RIFOXYC2_FULL_38_9]
MHWLDILIIIWLGISLYSGLKMGFIYKAATTIGFFCGLWVASRYTPELAQKWHLGPWQMPFIFLLLMSLVSRVFGLAGWLINKLFHLVAILPFLKTFNRVLGGVLSLGLSCFVISSVLYVADIYAPQSIDPVMQKSIAGRNLLKLSIFYKPFLSAKLDDLIKKEKNKIPTIPSADIPNR